MDDSALQHVNVFVSGTDGYCAYRIPAIVVTRHGCSIEMPTMLEVERFVQRYGGL